MSSIEHITQRMSFVDEIERSIVLPAPGKEEYEALKASIAEQGVLIPIEVTADGKLLDGYQRWRACVELGIADPPKTIREIPPEQERVHAITLNLARRQMDAVTRAECVRELAEAKGLRLGTPGKQKGKADTLAAIAVEVGISERQLRRDQELLRLPAEIQEQVRKGEVTPRAAIAKAKPKPAPKPVLDPTGTYRAVVVEPDWSNQTFNQIAKLKLEDGRTVKELVSPEGCHVWLRTPSQHLGKAPALLSEWGLEYVTAVTLKTSGTPEAGFTRNTVHMMFGTFADQEVKGSPETLQDWSDSRSMIRKLVDTATPSAPMIGLRVREGKWTAYDVLTGDLLEPSEV